MFLIVSSCSTDYKNGCHIMKLFLPKWETNFCTDWVYIAKFLNVKIN